MPRLWGTEVPVLQDTALAMLSCLDLGAGLGVTPRDEQFSGSIPHLPCGLGESPTGKVGLDIKSTAPKGFPSYSHQHGLLLLGSLLISDLISAEDIHVPVPSLWVPKKNSK